MLEDGDRHRVHGVPHRDALALHQVEGEPGVEALHEDEGGAVAPAWRAGCRARPRCRTGAARAGRDPSAVRRSTLAAEPAVGHAVPVGDDRALGERRGARRVEDGEADRPGPPRRRGVEPAAHSGASPSSSTSRQPQAAGVGIGRVDDHAPEQREVLRREGAGLGVAQRRAGPRRACRGSPPGPGGRRRSSVVASDWREDVAQLVGLVARVQRDRHRADEARSRTGRRATRDDWGATARPCRPGRCRGRGGRERSGARPRRDPHT